jgi:BirA family biotin operon repressor/biotin-[acetyl-CoA-carboxylase] ligase
MIPTRQRLLALLADGALHSGARLADSLGISRTAVWKEVAELRERGIEIASHDRRGYQLARAVELLDADAMRAAAAAAGVRLPGELEVAFEIDSTNEYLYAESPPPPGQPRVVLAELQRAGRGRRGRSWLAPFGSGLTFSIGWSFADVPTDLAALSLAMGVQVVQGLRALGVDTARLKWPNDIVVGPRKLGGLLAQLRSETGAPAYVVVGLGLNIDLPQSARDAIAAPEALQACDLRDACGGQVPGRNRVAAVVVAAMLEGLDRFAREGFSPFAGPWRALDALLDEPVRIVQGDRSVDGIARGIDPSGALRAELDGRVERFFSGEASLRRASQREPR